MKKWAYIFGLMIIVITSCDDNDVAIFEKTADERVAEAIANLKQDLIAPANGWRVKYRPEQESGSYYVLMDFNEDNTVTIKSDLGNNDGEFFEQTITYRIDSSLGLELIMESYCFFSFLFEQDQASFLAEYEFNFVNKTPDDALVFNSKTDPGTPTVLLFEEALPDDTKLLATTLSTNLNTIGEDFDKFSSTLRLTYQNRDIALYIVMDNLRRIFTINSASRKTNILIKQDVDFSSPFTLKGDSLVLDQKFSATILNNNITIKSIKFNTLTEGTISVCPSPTTVHSYDAVTSANDKVALESTLVDATGADFTTTSDFYYSPIQYILDNGESAAQQIAADITGATYMLLYYDYDRGDGTRLNALGFYIQNPNGTITFAAREFTPTLVGNKITFDFADDITILGEPTTPANTDNIDIYLDLMTEGDNTFAFTVEDGIYEFFNPCTGWTFAFIDGN
jgi:hypothetical protein